MGNDSGQDIIESLRRIEQKLDELLALITDAPEPEDEQPETYTCPRCGMEIEEGISTHYCEAKG